MNRKRTHHKPRLSLAELQESVQEAILNASQAPPAFIVDTETVPAADRFQVYIQAYRLRLTEALAADYPALVDDLGEDGFDALSRAYAAAHPSNQFSIRWFGRDLPRFLRETPPYHNQPGLSDLASFEWALSEVFDAPDSPAMDFDRLAGLSPELWGSLRLCFRPCLRRIDLTHNAPEIWQASNERQPLPALRQLEAPQAWIVWRRDLKLFFRSLPAPEAWAMDAFMERRCFADICEGLCEWMKETEVAQSAAGFLRSWVHARWIAGFTTDLQRPFRAGDGR